jgi:hypothetical protein
MGWTTEDVARLYRDRGEVPPQGFQGEKEIRAHKYGAVKKVLDGRKFDSTVEAEAYVLLKHWERMGVIRNLEFQPAFVLQDKMRIQTPDGCRTQRSVKYLADFRFDIDCGPDGWRSRVVDIKGFRPAVFVIKEKLFRAKFPDVDLQVWDRKKVKELSRI